MDVQSSESAGPGRRLPSPLVTPAMLALCLLAVTAAPAWAAPPDDEAVLDRYERALSSRPLDVRIKRSATGEAPPGRHMLPPPDNGHLRIEQPGRLWLQIYRGENPVETTVTDGKTLRRWNNKFFIESPAPRALSSLVPDIEWTEKAYWPVIAFTSPAFIRSLHDRRVDQQKGRTDGRDGGRDVIRISGRLHPGQEAARLMLELDATDHLPRVVQVQDGDVAVRLAFDLHAAPADAEVFAQRPPKGLFERSRDPEFPRIAAGSRAPNFKLRTLEGDPVTLAQTRGKVVLLEFWAPWCPACLLLTPYVNQLQKELGQERFQVIQIATMATREQLSAYLADHPQQGLVVHDPADEDDSVGHAKYKISGLPSFVVIDPRGRIQHAWKFYVPGATEARLRATVDDALTRRSRPRAGKARDARARRPGRSL